LFDVAHHPGHPAHPMCGGERFFERSASHEVSLWRYRASLA
jgi:hypothetical protein